MIRNLNIKSAVAGDLGLAGYSGYVIISSGMLQMEPSYRDGIEVQLQNKT